MKLKNFQDLKDAQTCWIQRDETEPEQKFTRIRKISRSDAAFVLEGELDESPCVVKVLRRETEEAVIPTAESFERQSSLLRLLKHPNIVKLFDSDARFLAIFLERLPWSLETWMFENVTFNTNDSSAIIYDVCSGLAELNQKDFSHNNIQPAHIAYSWERGAVLIGWSKATNIGEIDLEQCPAAYLPPEFLKTNTKVGAEGDVWALGITMLSVLGKFPFASSLTGSKIRTIEESLCSFEVWLDTVDDMRKRLDGTVLVERIVRDMLDPDPTTRISVSRVLENEELKKWNSERNSRRKLLET